MNADTALDQLRDAIRAEVRAELIAKLKAWHESLLQPDDEDPDTVLYHGGYQDGAEDAINTLRQA